MDGTAFYSFLRETLKENGQVIGDGFTFLGWYMKGDGTMSLRFVAGNGLINSIPQDIIIDAWEASLPMRDRWLVTKDYPRFSSDCRLHLLNDLILMYPSSRQIAA